MADISIIVPVYNEAENVLPLYYELRKYIPADYELVWVDDGSTDTTLTEIEELTLKDSRIKCVALTRNFGQSSAVSAGLDFATGRTIIIMNGNLRNPPSVVPALLAKINEGYEVVNTDVTSPNSVFIIQRILLNPCYWLLNKLAPYRNTNDITRFCAINETVVEGIHQLKENNLLLGNFFSWAGYKTTDVSYVCNECLPKHQKYSLEHLANQTKKAINHIHPGVFQSFFYMGFIFSFAAVVFALWQASLIIKGTDVKSGSIILTAMVLCSGIFLMIQSKKPEKAQLAKRSRKPGYLIKDVIEQENKSYKLSY
jgi:polyisoprenyl-phosphate glycosyltransferase